MSTIRVSAGLLLLLAAIALLASGAFGEVVITSNIPVVINIYNGVGTGPGGAITPADIQKAKDAVEEANKILKQAGYKLTPVKVNTYPFPGGKDLGDKNNDGKITEDSSPTTKDGEWRDVANEGEKEVKALGDKANGAGMKVNFVNTPELGGTTPGWAIHDRPVICVKHRESKEKTGETIAHEVGHMLTLSKGHKIDDTTTASNGGHAPSNKPGNTGKGNLMCPSQKSDGTPLRSGTHLTPAQIEEMRKKRWKRGLCSSQWEKAFPAVKVQAQVCLIVDDLADQTTGGGHNDLTSLTLTSLNGSPDFEGVITLADLLPDPVAASYAVAFDSDGNPATGHPYGPFAGMEYALEILVETVGGMTIASGAVRSLEPGGMTVSLPQPPIVVNEPKLLDLEGDADDVFAHLHFTLPKPMVGLTPTVNPAVPTIGIGVTASELGAVRDDASAAFHLDGWERTPALQTFGTGVPDPGAPYPFEVHGLEPNEPFTLYVDERPVMADALDATGSFVGSFIFPPDLPNSYFYFLTAQDSTGYFAAGNTCPNSVQTLVEAKNLADGGYVELLQGPGGTPGRPVSRALDGFFYVQADDRSGGIRVDSDVVLPPEADMPDAHIRASVFGTMDTNGDGERCIQALEVNVMSIEPSELKPLSMINRSVGGAGIAGFAELSNIGLLVQTWGMLVEVEPVAPPALPSWIKIDDGSGRLIKCEVPASWAMEQPLPWEAYLVITGISSCERDDSGSIGSKIIMRKPGDERIYGEP